jgi:phosphatidylinositol alpha-mannosyltransferase
MSSVDVYVAPNTGGESFGIVLVEAMAAGAAVVASDLVAFQDVATGADGDLSASLFRVGDSADLAAKVLALVTHPKQRAALAKRGQECALAFDWEVVAPQVVATYRDAIRMDAEFHPQPPQAKEAPA